MEEAFKRWTAKRWAALVAEIVQGKTTVVEASRTCDLPPSEIEEWGDKGKRGLENALRTKPLDIREQYERQIKELEAYGEAMLELRARKHSAGFLQDAYDSLFCETRLYATSHGGRLYIIAAPILGAVQPGQRNQHAKLSF